MIGLVLAIVLLQPATSEPVNVTTLTAKLGTTVNLTLDGPALGLACTQNNISLEFGDRVQLIDLDDGTATILISSIRGLDYGSYVCMWNNIASSIQRFELYVVGPISMKVEQNGRQLGDNVTITCEVTYYWIPNHTLTPDYIFSMTLGPLLLDLRDSSSSATPHRKRTLMYSGKIIEEMIRTNVVCLLKRQSTFSMMKYRRISVFAPFRKANIANKTITPAKIYRPGQTLICSADRDSLLAIGWEAQNLISPYCPVSPSTSADLNAGIAILTTTHDCLGTQTWRCFAIWADLTAEDDITIFVSNGSIPRSYQLFMLISIIRVMTFGL